MSPLRNQSLILGATPGAESVSAQAGTPANPRPTYHLPAGLAHLAVLPPAADSVGSLRPDSEQSEGPAPAFGAVNDSDDRLGDDAVSPQYRRDGAPPPRSGNSNGALPTALDLGLSPSSVGSDQPLLPRTPGLRPGGGTSSGGDHSAHGGVQ